MASTNFPSVIRSARLRIRGVAVGLEGSSSIYWLVLDSLCARPSSCVGLSNIGKRALKCIGSGEIERRLQCEELKDLRGALRREVELSGDKAPLQRFLPAKMWC